MAGTEQGLPLQGIEANYYNVTNNEGMPIAGLLVLLDRLHRPVRAELHLYDDISEEGREVAITQARTLLQDRYYSRTAVPMRILHTYPERSAVKVALPESQPAGVADSPSGVNWRTVAGVIGALALVGLLVWGAAAWLGGRNQPAAEEPPTAATAAPAGSDTADSGMETNGSAELPPSRNARSDIQIGSSVQIVPGYQLTLRSEPGPEAGEEIGYMAQDQIVEVVDGPVMTRGNSDTIVWWRVRLADGSEAWAAANTSDVTLLIPAE